MDKVIDSKLFREAKKFIPGGVNSPVRSFKAVGGYPVFIKRGRGSKLYAESGKTFIDYCLSWGALILGHANAEVTFALRQAAARGVSFGTATKLEIELARLIVEAYSSIEQVRLVNSGTEAVMTAIRLARAYSRKNKIIKFEGAYHGHADYLLTKAGSGLTTLGLPNSLGVPRDFTKYTLTAPFNDIKAVEQIVGKYHKDLAAIIVEPVAANCGLIAPQPEFLPSLRKIADRYNMVLIFDEVITGFRLSYSGAQGFFKVKPDLICLGKILGGGFPIGALGGDKKIMELLAPLGQVYQAGTLCGNPLAVSAAIVGLKKLRQIKPYKTLEEKTRGLAEAIELTAAKYRLKLRVNRISSMFSVFFTDRKVIDYKTAGKQNQNAFKRFFQGLLKEGVYFSPSGFETNFLSIAHTNQDLDKTKKAVEKVLSKT